MRTRWTNLTPVVTLCLLCFAHSLYAADAQNPEQRIQALEFTLQETQVARRDAEAHLTAVQADLSQTRKELTELRKRYANLLNTSTKQADELHRVELSAADLLSGKSPNDPKLLSAALEAVQDVESRREVLALKFDDLNKKVTSALDVLQASDLLRREVTTALSTFKKELERPVRALPSVAGRGSANPTRPSCRVLAVNDGLQLIVLDAGVDQGIRQGMNLVIKNGDKTVAKLRVVEVRSYISAAVVTDGSLKAVSPGAWAVFGQ